MRLCNSPDPFTGGQPGASRDEANDASETAAAQINQLSIIVIFFGPLSVMETVVFWLQRVILALLSKQIVFQST